MKRSKNVVLASMRKNWRPASAVPVTVAFTSFALSGCSDSGKEVTIYKTLKDCEKDNPGYSQECKAAYQKALDEAARTAPKYNSRYDCEAEFGANTCVQFQNRNTFMPAMAGFMFARMMDRDRRYYSQPVFSSYNSSSNFYNRWTTADGYDYGNSRYKQSKVTVSNDHMDPKPTVTRTISRGGFGSTVAAKSSWSSSSRSSGGWKSSSRSSSGGWGG